MPNTWNRITFDANPNTQPDMTHVGPKQDVCQLDLVIGSNTPPPVFLTWHKLQTRCLPTEYWLKGFCEFQCSSYHYSFETKKKNGFEFQFPQNSANQRQNEQTLKSNLRSSLESGGIRMWDSIS